MKRAAALLALLLALAGCRDRAGPVPGPTVRVYVAWSGASPGEVDRELVPVVEHALTGLPGLTHLRSHAQADLATIELTGVSAEATVAALDAARAALPETADAPVVQRINPAVPGLVALADDGRMTAIELGDRLRALERTAGLQVRERCGAAEAEVVVIVEPARLAATGLSLVEVAARIEAGAIDDVAALGRLALTEQVTLADVAMIQRGPGGGCRATLDGTGAAIAVVTHGRGARLPDGLRALDGPALEGQLTIETERQIPRLIEAARAAIGTPRWLVTRFDPELGRLTISIGLARGMRGADVAAAIDDAAAKAQLAPARWTGPGLVVATAEVRGPDARAVGPRLAAALRTAAGIASAGCEPCALHPTATLHLNNTRLAAIGARRADVGHLAAIAQGGLTLHGPLPVRLAVPEDTDLAALLLRTDDAGLVPLGDLLDLQQEDVPAEYLRIDGEPAVELWARGGPGTSSSALRELIQAR